MRGAAFALLVASCVGAGAAFAQDAVPAIDRIVVHKGTRTMELIASGQIVQVFHGIQLGANPLGPKHVRGDRRTPEGHYASEFGNDRSAYRLALHVSYPGPEDIARARAAGRSPGGAVFIHGQPNDWTGAGRVPGDWTDGCIALADDEIELLWRTAPDGTPIDIYP